MGYVDKLIGWIGRHPYLSALGLIGLFVGGVAYASSDTVKKTVDKNYEKGSKFVKEKYVNVFAPASAVAVPAVNETVKPTPQLDFLTYDGIKIIGDDQFQKDVVMTLEFGKKYYPEGKLKYTKEIESSKNPEILEMAAGLGYTSINASAIDRLIERGNIKTALTEIKHEEYHNYASLNDPQNNTEKRAIEEQNKVWNKLFTMNQSEIDKFYQEFNFSQFKK